MSHLKLSGLVGLLASAVGCSEPSCCIDRYPLTFAVVYGTVRLPSQLPAPNAIVRAPGGGGVRTDSAGRYRLAISLYGLPEGTWPLAMTAFRPDSAAGLADSTRVEARVPLFASQPVRDSGRVDIVLAAKP